MVIDQKELRRWQRNGRFCPLNSFQPGLREQDVAIKVDSCSGGYMSPRTFLWGHRASFKYTVSRQTSIKWLIPAEDLKNDVKVITCPYVSFTVNRCLFQLAFDAEESEKCLVFCNILH